MNKLKILMLNTQAAGVSYYRHDLPARALRAQGHDVTYFPSEINFFHEVGKLGSVEEWLMEEGWKYDIVHMGYSTVVEHVEAAVTLREMARVKHGKNQKLIVDLDDDINNVPSYNVAYKYYAGDAKEGRVARMLLRMSDGVVVTKEQLRQSVALDCPSTYIVGNYCDPEDWKGLARDGREDNDVRVLVTGNMGRKGDMDTIEEPLRKLVDSDSRVKVLFLGCTPDWAADWLDNKRDPKANRAFYIQPCEVHLYPQILSWLKPDILLAPVIPNEFNRSKSCIKAYDAAMTGAALICTDWDTYEEVPDNACVKCWSPYQWEEALVNLAEDAKMRHRLNARLRAWVVEKMHVSNYNKLGDYYAQVMKQPPITEVGDVVRRRVIT